MKGPAAALSSRGIQSEGDFHPAGERHELGVVNTDTRGALPGQTLPLFLLQAPIYSPPNFTPFLAVISSVCVTSSYPSIIITGWCSPLARCPHFLTMQSCKERMQKQAGVKERMQKQVVRSSLSLQALLSPCHLLSWDGGVTAEIRCALLLPQ